MELTSFLLGVFHLCVFLSFCHCQGNYENVALDKPCNMSSMLHAQPDCKGAVNGNTDGRYMANGDNCIRTNTAETSSWWEVNLGRPYPVCNITIWPRLSDPDRMVGVSVSIDSIFYFTFTATPPMPKFTIFCPNNPWPGTVIRLYKNDTHVAMKNRTINLCEVEVLSCNDAYWGLWCNKTCGNCGNGEVCDKVTGHCTSCLQGWELPMCSGCRDGYWGSQCKKCGNCSNSEVCDTATGHCTTCSAGWKPPLCAAPEEAPSGAEEAPSGASSGAVIGAVVGVLLVIVVVAIVVVFIWRRRRNNPKQEMNGTTVGQTTHDAVYQNVNGTLDGGSTSRARRTETNEAYANVTFDNDAAEPTVRGQPVSQPRTQSVSDPPIPQMEEGDVDVVEDNEVVVEGDQSYDIAVRGRVYYNDEVYMTSAGSSLKLDQVQEYLLGKLRSDDLDTEFKKLPLGLLKDHEAGLRKENRDKNRYNAILPYDETRVVLRGPYDKDSTDYINASFMRGHQSRKAYIATQGPRRNTTGDFWKTVWQNNVSNIVMLTNLKEDGKKKCEQYWPSQGKQYRYGLVDVLGLEERVRADYVRRTFQIRLGKEKVRNVTQYHYTTWPDHGIPKTTALVDFWRTVHTAHRAQTRASSLLVHCSAGIGRTGTFIALDIVKNQLRDQQHIDVFQVLKDMRNDRCYMIQTKSQYSILYEAVLESYTTKDCRLQLEAFDFAFNHPVDPHNKHERTEAEFRELKQMKVLMQKPSHVEAEKIENINKNRDTSTLPGIY
ncbi:hypothetical protein V1264_021197 [Littorina saxatilis]|uniref:protein-tyrosine-phosphatase n=1 Tax=Littorina saxatilis TaxID=31220 RepID=A0AAN9GD16_9CAEN